MRGRVVIKTAERRAVPVTQHEAPMRTVLKYASQVTIAAAGRLGDTIGPLGPSTTFFTTYGPLLTGGTRSQSGAYSNDSWYWGARQYFSVSSGTGPVTATNDLIIVSGALLSLNVAVYF